MIGAASLLLALLGCARISSWQGRGRLQLLAKCQDGAILVLSCTENITAENFEGFKKEYKTAISELSVNDSVIVNLSKVEHIASAALGLIASSYPDVLSRGNKMRVVTQSEEILRLLNVTRLSRVIDVDPDLETAKKALQ